MLFKKLASLALLATAATVQAVSGAAFDHVFVIFLENTVSISLVFSIVTSNESMTTQN